MHLTSVRRIRLLLMLLEVKIDAATWVDIAAILELYLLRLRSLQYEHKKLQSGVLSLTKALRRDGVTPENLVKLLTAQSGEFVEWPNDAAFRDLMTN